MFSMPPAMSKEDPLTHIEVVKDQELNPIVDDCEVERWDPMIHEASIAHVPLLPMLDGKGCSL